MIDGGRGAAVAREPWRPSAAATSWKPRLQSAHAVRRRTGKADWPAIEQLYDALCTLTGSPVAALNRAVALAETRGPASGLEALDALAGDDRLANYQPYWAARADLLARSGALEAALEAYSRAIGLESDPEVRDFLQQRAASARARSTALIGRRHSRSLQAWVGGGPVYPVTSTGHLAHRVPGAGRDVLAKRLLDQAHEDRAARPRNVGAEDFGPPHAQNPGTVEGDRQRRRANRSQRAGR